jgi:hypothetical protein
MPGTSDGSTLRVENDAAEGIGFKRGGFSGLECIVTVGTVIIERCCTT